MSSFLLDLGSSHKREYRFLLEKEWRMDFAWPEEKVALEIQGGTFLKRGGHTSPTGYARDCAKYNAATLRGWAVFQLTSPMITPEYALAITNFVKARSSSRRSSIG